jgi:hypothetical protein
VTTGRRAVATLIRDVAKHLEIVVQPLAVVKDATFSAPDQARFNCEQLESTYQAKLAKKEGLELAVALTKHEAHPDAAPSFLAKADRFRDYVRSYPRRASADIEDLEVEIGLLLPDLTAAREKLREALEVESDQLAKPFIPRHREAVTQITAALELLSAAVWSEYEIRMEFAEASPVFPISWRLPDMGSAWRSALLNDPRSFASQWVRSAQNLKAGNASKS